MLSIFSFYCQIFFVKYRRWFILEWKVYNWKQWLIGNSCISFKLKVKKMHKPKCIYHNDDQNHEFNIIYWLVCNSTDLLLGVQMQFIDTSIMSIKSKFIRFKQTSMDTKIIMLYIYILQGKFFSVECCNIKSGRRICNIQHQGSNSI